MNEYWHTSVFVGRKDGGVVRGHWNYNIAPIIGKQLIYANWHAYALNNSTGIGLRVQLIPSQFAATNAITWNTQPPLFPDNAVLSNPIYYVWMELTPKVG
jgi:hypothetical protein